jgi:hypothetical protein
MTVLHFFISKNLTSDLKLRYITEISNLQFENSGELMSLTDRIIKGIRDTEFWHYSGGQVYYTIDDAQDSVPVNQTLDVVDFTF